MYKMTVFMVRNSAARTYTLPNDEDIIDDCADDGCDKDRWENDGGKIHGTIHGPRHD